MAGLIYIFQNINFQLHYLAHFKQGNASTLNMTDSTMEFFVKDLSRTTLIYLKWIFSGLFILIYLIHFIFLEFWEILQFWEYREILGFWKF